MYRTLLVFALRLFRITLKIFLNSTSYARFCGVTIGESSRFLSRNFSSEPFLITIGSNTTIAANVFLLTHDYAHSLIHDTKLYKPVTIGSNCFVGVNSVIMPGVIVSDNVIIGASSVVTKSIPPSVVVAGNPARIISHRDQFVPDFSHFEHPRKFTRPLLISREYFNMVFDSLDFQSTKPI